MGCQHIHGGGHAGNKGRQVSFGLLAVVRQFQGDELDRRIRLLHSRSGAVVMVACALNRRKQGIEFGKIPGVRSVEGVTIGGYHRGLPSEVTCTRVCAGATAFKSRGGAQCISEPGDWLHAAIWTRVEREALRLLSGRKPPRRWRPTSGRLRISLDFQHLLTGIPFASLADQKEVREDEKGTWGIDIGGRFCAGCTARGVQRGSRRSGSGIRSAGARGSRGGAALPGSRIH